MNDVVMYVFAGRRQNMALQMPLYKRILAENPNVRLDVWNLTRLFHDEEYVKQQIRGERIKVRHDFQKYRPWWRRFDYVWRYYSHPKYEGTHFVKLDDDVVFMQTDRFADFVEQSRLAPGVISSALTINNGASIKHTPGMSAPFKKLGVPLLDVHTSGEFARFSHGFALDHWDKLLHMPIKAVPTKDWLSINMIAYDWATGCRVAEPLAMPSPEEIAGRAFESTALLGDEGSCNLQPRQVVKGFLAAHLTFGPQKLSPEVWDAYRQSYAALGKDYLAR